MAMKMIIAIVDDSDTPDVISRLDEAGIIFSKIDTTGGFLRKGKSTLMLGVKENEVDRAIDTINQSCDPSVNPLKNKATIMVLNVEHFEQI